jgi:hypothetical protein
MQVEEYDYQCRYNSTDWKVSAYLLALMIKTCKSILHAYIQKHHLQLAWSVRAPPSGGPKARESPNTLTMTPR